MRSIAPPRPKLHLIAITSALVVAVAVAPDGTSRAVAESHVPYSTGDAYVLPSTASPILAADLNRDHANDLLFSDSLWINDGTGHFSKHALALGGVLVRAADMDGDGILDLVTATDVHRGRGDGTFEAPRPYRSGTACGLAVGDLDEDGRLDIAVVDCTVGDLWIYARRDTGYVQELLRSKVPHPTQLIVTDLNGDTIADLAVIGSDSDSALIAVRSGLGSGEFAEPVTRAFAPTNPGVAVGDLDSDGFPDLAISRWSDWVMIAWNDGHGRFIDTTTLSMRDDEYEYLSAAPALADIDGDGRLDIASAVNVRQANRVQLFLNLGDRRFDASLAYYIGSLKDVGYLERVAMVDVDGNDGPEIFALSNHHPGTTSEMRIIHHLRGRAFAGVEDYAVGNEWLRLEAVDQGTGRQDLVVHGTAHSWRMRSRPDGTFDAPIEVAAVASAPERFDPVPWPPVLYEPLTVIADFDRDGLDDRAVVQRVDTELGAEDSLTIFHANPDGSMTVVGGQGIPPPLACCPLHPSQFWTAKLNGDPYPDLLLVEEAGNSSGQMSVLLNRGDGRFADAVGYRIRPEDPVIQSLDLDGDGIDDLLARPCVGDWLLVEINPGDGTFQSNNYPFVSDYAAYFGVPDYPIPVIGDFNGDRRPDIAFAYDEYTDGPQGGVGVLLNLGPEHTTPVLLSCTRATYENGEIHLMWQAGPSAPMRLNVERAIGNGPWTFAGPADIASAGVIEYHDHDARPGERHRYRLVDEAGERWSAEASVDVPSRVAGLMLGSIRPNPVQREARVSFALASDAPARVEVLEISGRRVMTVPISSGTRSLELSIPRAVAPGIYWIRLTQGAASAIARMVLVR